jgi:hypothetical protein
VGQGFAVVPLASPAPAEGEEMSIAVETQLIAMLQELTARETTRYARLRTAARALCWALRNDGRTGTWADELAALEKEIEEIGEKP